MQTGETKCYKWPTRLWFNI